MKLSDNPILRTDSYKFSHWNMYPRGITGMHAYLEARGSDLPFFNNRVVVFGIQYIIQKYFAGVRITVEHVEQAKEFVDQHIGEGVFNYDGWMFIATELNGVLPLEIRGLPEGTIAPFSTALVTVRETHPKCAWLVSYFEPILLHLWYPMTVCTLGFEIKQVIREFYNMTAHDEYSFALHDFGYRGVSSHETAEIGGLAHIVNFAGSDTVAGIIAAKEYYNVPGMAAWSVRASEHTVMCSLSDAEDRNDYAAAVRMVEILEETGGIVSVVADTYDVFRFVETFVGNDLKNRVINSGGRLVIRPDSGDPCVVPIKVIELLLHSFGYTVNSKGYKVLPDCVRVIQGDGVNIHTIKRILHQLEVKGIAACNIIFGSGGALLQHCDRDWLKFAIKASAVEVDGHWKDVFKDPITDSRKTSKKGRLTTFKDGSGKLLTDRVELATVNRQLVDAMVTYYKDGQMVVSESLDQIRARIEEQLE